MNHRWKIHNLKRTVADGMVFVATWQCVTTYGLIPEYPNQKSILTRGNIYLATGSAFDPNFTPYDQLTQDEVLSWITGSIDQTAIEQANSASLAAQIDAELNPVTSSGLPW